MRDFEPDFDDELFDDDFFELDEEEAWTWTPTASSESPLLTAARLASSAAIRSGTLAGSGASGWR